MTIHRRSLLTVIAAGSGVLAMPFAARAEGTLEAVKKRGTFRVGVTQAPPWFSKDPKTGQWSSGLGVSFGKAMADKLGAKMETVEVSWGNSIAALQGDKIDIMFMIDATPERKQAVDFPESPLLWYALAVLAKDDLAVKTWDDLNKAGVSIAVPQASSMDRYVSEHAAKADIQRFPDNAAAIAAFQSGRVDAVVLFHPPLLAARQKLGKGKIVVPTPAVWQASSTALRKGDTEFVAWVDQQLAENYKSGQTREMVRAGARRLRPRPQARPAGHEGDDQVGEGSWLGARHSSAAQAHERALECRAPSHELSLGLHAGLRQRAVAGGGAGEHAQGHRRVAGLRPRARAGAGADAAVAPSAGVVAGRLRHRGLPHHAAAGPALLVLLRPAADGRHRDDAVHRRRVTFSIQSAAFFAEVFRAGIRSIERGQWDGARAIGMTHGQAMQRIVLPQAVKRMIPAFMERSIELMKTTTLVATIAYADLLFAANEVSQKASGRSRPTPSWR